jgi:hypothetical protein
MSTITTPINRQARTTVSILNTVRTIGTGFYALAAALLALGTLVAAASSDRPGLTFIIGLIWTGMTVVFGALFYAVVGWFAGTLTLLKQIAQNTNQNA